MSFLLQRVSGRSLTLVQVPGSVLRIGRGTNQELRSENPAVALEHAIVEVDAAGYIITDKGSITGTYVNRKPVESARIGKGDVVEIGDLRIEVQIADPAKPLFLRVITARAPTGSVDEEEQQPVVIAKPGAASVKARKIDYASSYRLTRPWLTKLSVTAIVLIVALTVIGELILPQRQAAFMPGGLSSAHARARDPHGNAVAGQCSACHVPFRSVSSAKCRDCHAQPPHAQFATANPDCFTCHAEHRGATKLAAISDQTCTGCHADLAAHMRGPRAELAALHFAGNRYAFDSIARITAFGDVHPEFSYFDDRDSLRFNHKLHLAPKGVFNASGKRQVLTCTGCHALTTVKAKTDPGPIRFAEHCQGCHKLTFDARFPTAEVPHGGDPGIVYGYVGGMYSGDRDLAGKAPAEVRRILSSRSAAPLDRSGVLYAEQVMKGKCVKCHEVERRGARYAVTPPVIRTAWLDRSHFTHGRHANIGCEQCHEGVRGSVATADVLMPKQAVCAGCHARNAKVAQAASTCVSCHEYHLRPQAPVVKSSLVLAGVGGLGGGGRMLQGILLAVIVVLLLVVAVPVGIALFQRLRPERAAAPPAKAPSKSPRTPPPAMPPQRVTPEAPTDKVARQNVPPPDLTTRPAPAAPAVVPVDVTRVPMPEPDAGGGTEMVQWNGLLHCTSGPLEGQRFVIEDEGLYIGRDPGLAKIVVPDSRVSKRHLRIVPRDGKVWAIDQGSTNGTFLRDQRITEVQLKRGDTLVLGDNAVTFVYQI